MVLPADTSFVRKNGFKFSKLVNIGAITLLVLAVIALFFTQKLPVSSPPANRQTASVAPATEPPAQN